MQALFQSAQHLYEKREGAGSGSVPVTDPDLDLGGPKTSGSGSPTLRYGILLIYLGTVYNVFQAACNGPYDGKWSKTMIG